MDLQRLWASVLDELELLITKPTFNAFFTSSYLRSLENGVATIGCANGIAVTMMETRYYSLIKNLLDKHAKENFSLLFKVAPLKKAELPDAGPLFAPLHEPPVDDLSLRIKAARLRPEFTFATFAVSGTNHLAYAAATAVAASPGTSYNPLFFYGGVGVGKTHLMQAIGHEALKQKPQYKVIYCTGEEFTNEIIDAMQTKATKRFKDRYRSARVLLIDDIQFLEGKLRIQEEFFHTFNAVTREGGQIVMTSDRVPADINNLEERLKSRFEAGLVVDVQNPDFELRCAILKIKAQQQGVELPFEVVQILAANADTARRLEGLLLRLLTEVRIKHTPLSQELAQTVVGKPLEVKEDHKKLITTKQVTDLIIKRYGVTLTQLRGAERRRPLVRPRQMLMYLLRTELRLSLDEVGILVGGRDHTTVLHAVDKISTLVSTDEHYRQDLEWIKKELFG